MNKSLFTNLVSILIILIAYLIDMQTLLLIGLFALSGSITNTLAIHMLFHKIPLIYGSGVIEDSFEVFKESIFHLIMDQFFTKENVERFLVNENKNDKFSNNLSDIIEKTDFEPAFESLKAAVMESQFGSMLGMFGGEKALEPLKEPFEKKLKNSILNITQSDSFKVMAQNSFKESSLENDMISHIEIIVQARLDELTPKSVKAIIQDIIKEHLGWLVLWGGVFGGLIGLISGVIIG